MAFLRSKWIFPVGCGLAAVAFVALADCVVLPLHARGVGQPLTAWVDGFARLVELPGLMVAEKLGMRFRHHTEGNAWAVMLGVTGPVYFVAGALLRLWWGRRKGRRPGTSRDRKGVVPEASAVGPLEVSPATVARPEPRPPLRCDTPDPAPPRPVPSRRQFLAVGARRAVVVSAALAGGYAFAAEPRWFDVTRRRFTVRGLPSSLDGFTIAQLTDIHHGPWTSLAGVRAVVDATNALGVDLVALTGDYVHQSAAYIRPVIGELSRLRGRVGVVATLGNHDWWEDGWETIRALGDAGIPLVDNGRMFVTPDRFLLRALPASSGIQGLCVAGVGDLWEGSPDYDAALGGVPGHVPRVLLSHNPDVAEERKFLAAGFRVDLMLSGHTHGGQVRLPGLGTPMIPSRYGQKYASGLVQGPACPVYVCRGIGTTIMPLRLGVRPEIAVIELKVG